MVRFVNNEKINSCFKAYDIRGRIGSEINEDLAFKVGYAAAKKFQAKRVIIGYDARKSSPRLAKAVSEGARTFGAEVLALGLVGTEEVYSAVAEFLADVGIEVTASHNPIEYNGMKIVKSGAKPLTETDFLELKSLVEANCENRFLKNAAQLNYQAKARQVYIERILSFINLQVLKPLTIVVNSGNGAAGPVIDCFQEALQSKGVKAQIKKVHHNPDSNFPNGIPNPLLPKNQSTTSDMVKKVKADFGVAFDGDFDRCFLFDDLGNFVSGEYVIGLLAEVFLKKEPGSAIIHETRIIWNIEDTIRKFNGRPEISKTGHNFVKQNMRKAEAIYGGELSGHHYFRDFSYCDSGMLPWLLIWELLSSKNVNLSGLVASRKKQFPSSGEINFEVSDPELCIQRIKKNFHSKDASIDTLDGLSFSFSTWRFNVRKSNTENLIRLNLETKGDYNLLRQKTQLLKKLIVSK